jgi:hypothetical protein
MGAVKSLLRRTVTVEHAPDRPTFRFVVHLVRLPPYLPELDESFRQRHSAGAEVVCELEAKDFAEAVADAIRTLEEGFVRVEAIERLGLE